MEKEKEGNKIEGCAMVSHFFALRGNFILVKLWFC